MGAEKAFPPIYIFSDLYRGKQPVIEIQDALLEVQATLCSLIDRFCIAHILKNLCGKRGERFFGPRFRSVDHCGMRQRVFFTADASQCLPRVQSEPALAESPSASSGLSISNGAVATNGEAGLRLTATVPPSSSSSSSRLVASRQGTLSVEQVAHLNYVLRFRDEQVNRTADVDLVNLVADSHTVIMGDSLSVSVLDPLDFELLGEVVEECRTLCDHAIRLDSISRDAFYAAAFVGVDVKDLSVIDIQKMRDQYLAEARK